MKFHNKFIGNDLSSYISLFSGNDSQERYETCLTQQSTNWYYRTNQVTYDINSNGHRCRNIDNINLSNYILYTGCSHTAGTGIELEKSYPYVTSNLLECDYYNLALGGTGIDVLLFNLITWFASVKQLPKAVVIQWPDHSRFVTIKPNQLADDNTIITKHANIIPHGLWDNDATIISNILSNEESGSSFAKTVLAKKLIETVISCTIHYVTLKRQIIPDNIDSIEFAKLDFARDLSHFGIESNKKLAELLVDAIKKH